MTARSPGPFLVAADLLEHGVVTDETRARVKALIGEDLRASLSPGAREAVAHAYEALGKPVPEWCRP